MRPSKHFHSSYTRLLYQVIGACSNKTSRQGLSAILVQGGKETLTSESEHARGHCWNPKRQINIVQTIPAALSSHSGMYHEALGSNGCMTATEPNVKNTHVPHHPHRIYRMLPLKLEMDF